MTHKTYANHSIEFFNRAVCSQTTNIRLHALAFVCRRHSGSDMRHRIGVDNAALQRRRDTTALTYIP